MIRLVVFLFFVVAIGFLLMRAWGLFQKNRPKLVLLDRDGVINKDRKDYVKTTGEFQFIDGSIDAIKMLNEAGVHVVVVTNQGGIGRGLYTREDLEEIHAHMKEGLAEMGAHVDHIFFCADHPDSPTERRKPGTGMLEEGLAAVNVSSSQAHMVGDALRDMVPAKTLGIQRHLVLTGKGNQTLREQALKEVFPVRVHENLLEAVKSILAR